MPIESDPSLLSPSGRVIGELLGYYDPAKDSKDSMGEIYSDVYLFRRRGNFFAQANGSGILLTRFYGDEIWYTRDFEMITDPVEVSRIVFDEIDDDDSPDDLVEYYGGILLLIPEKNRIAIFEVMTQGNS